MGGKKSTERWNTAQDGIVYEMGCMDMGGRWLLLWPRWHGVIHGEQQQQRVKSGV